MLSDLCDAGPVLYRLSYQPNGELVAIRVDDKPADDGYMSICIHDVNT